LACAYTGIKHITTWNLCLDEVVSSCALQHIQTRLRNILREALNECITTKKTRVKEIVGGRKGQQIERQSGLSHHGLLVVLVAEGIKVGVERLLLGGLECVESVR
jgi:hypothetical protein